MNAAGNIVIFGATSAIAQATARQFAPRHPRMILVARDRDKLASVADDLTARGAQVVESICADLADFDGHEAVLATIRERFDGVDLALFAHGVLGDQKAAEADYQEAERIFRINFLSIVSLITPLANDMERRGRGSLVVVSSVAGDRGRQSNYVYGTSKAALNAFCQGLRNRLHPKGVQVLTVKPGFVDTPMTAGLKQGPLFASAEAVGRGIAKAVMKGRNEVYLPWFWCGIMTIIKAIPEAIFKRLRL